MAPLLVFGSASDNTEGRGDLTMASSSLQDLRRRLYVKAKADKDWQFWGLYVHVAKPETLRAAYDLAKRNNGAPGIDGVTFEAIEAAGVDAFLAQLQDELVARTYRPLRNRRVEIPKDDGKKVRVLGIPTVTAYCGAVQYAVRMCHGYAPLPPAGGPASANSLRASSSGRPHLCL
jgi:RNA-directed DNA polymerase